MIIISLGEERKMRMLKQLNELNITFPVIFLSATSIENNDGYLPMDENEEIKKHICCTKSHIRAIEEAGQETAPDVTIIIEDDASFHKTKFLPTVLEILRNWEKVVPTNSHMLSIGWFPMQDYKFYENIETKQYLSEYKFLKRFVYGTQAYMIKKSSAQKFYPILKKNTWIELKTTILDLNHEHIEKDNPIKNVDNWLNRFLGQTVVFPLLVIEQRLPSTIEQNGGLWHNDIWNTFFQDNKILQKDYWSF